MHSEPCGQRGYWVFHKSGLIVLALVTTYLLSSCQSFKNLQAWPPPYSLPAGSTISINQNLVVASHEVSVWVQYGKVIRRRDIDKDFAYCGFELYTLQPVERIIHKGEAVIKKIVNRTDYVSNDTIMLASTAYVSDDSGAPMAEIYSTNIYLQSQKQPDLYLLVCEHWEDPLAGTYLTIDQIQEALGSIATFHYPKQ